MRHNTITASKVMASLFKLVLSLEKAGDFDSQMLSLEPTSITTAELL